LAFDPDEFTETGNKYRKSFIISLIFIVIFFVLFSMYVVIKYAGLKEFFELLTL